MIKFSEATKKGGRVRYAVGAAFALATMAFLQTGMGKASFFAEPDRAMSNLGFSWRKNNVETSAPPVLYVRIGDRMLSEYWRASKGIDLFPGRAANSSKSALGKVSLVTPRAVLADLLATTHRANTARAVVLDVDLAWVSDDPAGEARLAEELRSWSGDPKAPLLVLAREVAPISAQDDETNPSGLRQLPPTAFDDIVQPSPNIVYSIVSQNVDPSGMAREYDQVACAIAPDGRRAIPSAVWAVEAAALADTGAMAKKQLAARTAQVTAACRSGGPIPVAEEISYHLDVGPSADGSGGGATRLSAAPVTKGWRDYKSCGAPPSAAWVPAEEFQRAAHGSALKDFLCGQIVFIGGNNVLQADTYRSPYGPMDGALVLANAARGRLITGDVSSAEYHYARLGVQILLILITVNLIRHAFMAIGKIRSHLHRIEIENLGIKSFFVGCGRLIVHPVTINWAAPLVIFFLGAIVTALALQFNLIFISMPAFAAASSETIFEFESDLA